MGRLDQKVAFITGAGAGIARAAALVFAREGAKTAIIDVNEEAGENTVRLIRERGSEAIFVHTDITQEHSVKNAVTDTTRHFGRIDILFNCAGGSVAGDNLLADVTELKSVFERTMSVDLFGTMLCCKHVIPEIVKAGGGTVVNMSSGAALRGASPLQVYTSAKGAIVSLTRTLAWTYADQNVRVNAIAAGRVPTERTDGRHRAQRGAKSALGRFFAQDAGKNYPFWIGEPEDIANVVLFLASYESRMITGVTIPADGGRSSY